ncbi:DR2241 family protein [Halorubellus sp. PRR65]|uniref:DR2241 family protein n=1 Tax=Halorubellus sp. PRR65 TaxID=3098148 RepID=UPI002B25ABE7|nr:DR2241 family protein [Halorubellus sp. PRR65]
MDDEQLTALSAAVTVEDDLAFDGLHVTRRDDGYRFELSDLERGGLSEEELRRVARANPEHVSNWYFWHDVAPTAGSARFDFLRYVERVADHDAPTETRGHGGDATHGTTYEPTAVLDRYRALERGIERQWGELHLSVELADDGYRRYEVRHVDDADADPDDLDEHRDVRDARDVAKFDDRGRYRPLKTAPTLPAGWRFPELTSGEVVAVVESIYPATIANWHREREGNLDVDHWEPAMARQSGIYGVVQTWNRGEGTEHVERVAESCCADSECLKRREWGYDEDTDLEADGGVGAFPCREPCSMVVSAARKWTKLEGEDAQTYEFELTPSEKEQLEAIVDTVADGDVDEVREADFRHDANRWRTRYLREKRMDEDGNLCGVPTDGDD